VVRIESARSVRQDEPHVRIAGAIAADVLLVNRIGQRAAAHHVQGDGESFFVCDPHLLFGEIARDRRLESRLFRRKDVVALEAGKTFAAYRLADELRIHSWMHQHQRTRAGVAAGFGGEKRVGSIEIHPGRGKSKEQPLTRSAGMNFIHAGAERRVARAGRAGENQRRNFPSEVAPLVKMRVSVEDARRHEGLEFAAE